MLAVSVIIVMFVYWDTFGVRAYWIRVSFPFVYQILFFLANERCIACGSLV